MYLRIEHISKHYGNVKALSDISFSVTRGTVHALCGENGAGKSTLLKILGGHITAGNYEGNFFIDDRQQQFHSIAHATRSGIAVITQELALVPHMSVAENIFLGHLPTTNYLVDTHSMHTAAQRILQSLHCHIDTHSTVAALGIGQQQMIEIAKAISQQADILILDEPTAALSETESQHLLSLLRTLRTQGVTCLLVSHKLKEVMQIADDITVLRDGQSIDTIAATKTNENALVAKMVGRTMHDFFNKQSMEVGSTVLKISNLSSHLSNGSAMHRQIHFEVKRGAIVGIAGMMGSGRTELLQILFGAYPYPWQGNISLNNTNFRPSYPRQAIDAGVVLISEDRKHYGLFIDKAINFNSSIAVLNQFAKNAVINDHLLDSYVHNQAAHLKLKAESIYVNVAALSGGNQQKVVLSKWMKNIPTLLLADEPTRGIDVGAKSEIYNVMYNLAAQGTAILVVSSDMHELMGICDTIHVMAAGTINATLQREDFDERTILHYALEL